MSELIFEDEDVESHTNMEHNATHQNGGHAQPNEITQCAR